jgi:hypothetical protein
MEGDMKSFSSVAVGILALVLAALLFIQMRNVGSSAKGGLQRLDSRVINLEDSVLKLRTELDEMKDQVPGLGEFMNAMQLHIAKLWYAGGAGNWKLADYELHELTEGIQGAESLHAEKNNVKITPVLQAMQKTLVDSLALAVKANDEIQFKLAYGRTISTCNDCHKAAGYPFIYVINPTGEPIMNQAWKAAH